jgi:predicted transcriptional regulator
MMRIKDVLRKMKVKDITHTEFISLDPTMSIEDAVREEFTKHDYSVIPIARGENILGLLTLSEIKRIPRLKWNDIQVSQIMKKISNNNSLHREESALVALTKMVKAKADLLPVIDNALIKGIVTQDDLLGIINNTEDNNSGVLT